MKKECVAMLLAGGQGSRLYVLTGDMAKPSVRQLRAENRRSLMSGSTATKKYSRWYRQELRLRMSLMQRIWQKRNKKRIDRFLTKRYHSFNVVKQYRITA